MKQPDSVGRSCNRYGMQITEKTLTSWLDGEGFSLVEDDSLGLWGWTSVEHRTVALNPRLKQFQRVPVLLHECFHVYYGHEGLQSRAVEQQINMKVAKLLVDPVEYAFWESQYGWNTGGIAAALELPRWVVQAYRRAMRASISGAGSPSIAVFNQFDAAT